MSELTIPEKTDKDYIHELETALHDQRAKEEREAWSSGYDATLLGNAIVLGKATGALSCAESADVKLKAYRAKFFPVGGAE